MKFYLAPSALLNWVHELLHRENWSIRGHLIAPVPLQILKTWAVFRQLNRTWNTHGQGLASTFMYCGDTSGYPRMQNKSYHIKKCTRRNGHKWRIREKGSRTLQQNKYPSEIYPGGRSIKLQKYSRLMFKCLLVRLPLLQQHASTSR